MANNLDRAGRLLLDMLLMIINIVCIVDCCLQRSEERPDSGHNNTHKIYWPLLTHQTDLDYYCSLSTPANAVHWLLLYHEY
jgi:hypothetical protein